MHLDSGIVEVRGGRQSDGPGGSLGLLGESRVATNIRGFFAQRIALPDTGEYGQHFDLISTLLIINYNITTRSSSKSFISFHETNYNVKPVLNNIREQTKIHLVKLFFKLSFFKKFE